MEFKQMIREIRSEPLQTLISSVRCEESSPLNFYASEPLEHSSSTRQALLSDLLRLGDVVEIQGPPASGKSHLLYLLMFICIIPPAYASISLGGWDKAALLFDTDASFDLARFKRLLTSHLEAALKNQDPSVIQLLVKRALQNLHIFRPTSSVQLAATLLRLPWYHQNKLSDSEIGILAVDSMSAFYWSDRFTYEQLKATHAHRVKDSLNPLQHVITALQKFYRTHKPLVIFTNWGLTPTQPNIIEGEANVPTYRQHLNPPPALFFNVEAGSMPELSFSSALPLTFHITLSMSTLPQFPLDLSFEDVCAQELSFDSTNRQIVGVIRYGGGSQTSRFAFNIEADHVDTPIVLVLPTSDK